MSLCVIHSISLRDPLVLSAWSTRSLFVIHWNMLCLTWRYVVMSLSRAYYNIRCSRSRLFDVNQHCEIFSVFSWIFLWKVLAVPKKVVPLHPLTRNTTSWARKKSVLWKIYIDRSSTRSGIFYICRVIETNRLILEYWIVVLRQINEFTSLLGANAEPSLLELCWATTKTRRNFEEIYTMKSLILAQDER